MPVRRLLIAYYSRTGKTETMARAIAKGAKRRGIRVDVKPVEECILNDLAEADGIVVGSPTYFSNVAWQVKKLIDESIVLYRNGRQLRGKVGGCFTSAGTRRDGKDCVRMLELTLALHHRVKVFRGVICLSRDAEEEVANVCREYGKEIARQVLS